MRESSDYGAPPAGITRRGALELGAVASAVSAMTALPTLARGAGASPPGLIIGRIGLVVIERRLPGADLFFQATRGEGLPTRHIDHGLTALWTRDLNLRWRGSGPRAGLAGLTSTHALLCLEQLAHLHDMRVVWREAPPSADAASQAATAKPWALDTARIWRGRDLPAMRAGQTSAILTADQLRPGAAMAWVIAPRRVADRA